MDNKKVDSKIIKDWLHKGDEDELLAISILKHRDSNPSSVCFVSQQMVEKYMKGLLLYCTNDYPKSHDLVYLMKLLKEHEIDILTFKNDFAVLSEYYISTRYPGDFPEFSWEDAEEAFSSAEKIKKFVLDKIEKLEK